MFCFVGLKCQKCRDLRALLGVKSGLLILVRVKDLTFSNSEPTAIPLNAHILKLTLLQVSLPLFESAPGGRCASGLRTAVDIPACIVDFVFVLPSRVRLTDYSASTFRWIPNLKTAPGRWRVRHTTNLNNLKIGWKLVFLGSFVCVSDCGSSMF